MAKAKGKTKEAPAEEAEDDVELEELSEDVEDEAKETKSKAQEVTFGVSDLAKHLSKGRDKPITPRDLRTLIRKMAREEKARVNREIKAGNRTRYDWPKGLKDPEVKAIIAAVEKGELEEGKKAALDELKRKKAEKNAAAKKGKDAGKGKKGKGKSKAADEDVDEVELEDDDD